MKEPCGEDENTSQNDLSMLFLLLHELLLKINRCTLLSYTHTKDAIHLKIKLDVCYLVINYSFASYKIGLRISYLRSTL
jgi:hypothetical protein